MRKVSLVLLLVALLWSYEGANAQSESLTPLVTQLQKTPADAALREKIIKLAVEMKPAPALPEEATRRMARGEAAFESAKDASDYDKAIAEFQAAANVAPWYPDSYYNLGLTQEKANKAKDAMQSFRLYLLAAPDAKDAADIKKRLYKLEYAAEQQSQAAAENAKQLASQNAKAAESAAIDAKATLLEGEWYQDVSRHDASRSGDKYLETLSIKRDAGGGWRVQFLFTRNGNVVSDFHPYDVRFVGTQLRFKRDHTYGVQVVATDEVIPTPSADGNTLNVAYTPMPLTAAQEAYWREWDRYRPRPHVDEFKRR